MSEILKNKQGDDISLPYYHGAVLDIDVDKILTMDGDYLLQSKHIAGKPRPRLFLAIRWNKEVHRYEVKKTEKGEIKVGNNIFANVRKMVEKHITQPLIIGKDHLLLKKAIPKGKFQLSHSDIRMMKKIGSGAYGTVFLGLLLKSNRTIAVKRLDTDGFFDEEALNEMMKEARVMQLYDHRNVVRFYGFIVDRMPYLLVMEFCDRGAVEDLLRSHGKRITVAQRIDMATQTSYGLEYLHWKECIHRDIATRNCLIDRKVVKLADFGMCRPTAVYKVDLSKPTNVRWLAPEVWKIGETRYNTDIYAFGVMMWEMFCQPYKCPYNEWKAHKVKTKVMEGYRLPAPEGMPKDMADIMELAWCHDPAKRPTAPELRSWLDNVNSSATKTQASVTKSVSAKKNSIRKKRSRAALS